MSDKKLKGLFKNFINPRFKEWKEDAENLRRRYYIINQMLQDASKEDSSIDKLEKLKSDAFNDYIDCIYDRYESEYQYESESILGEQPFTFEFPKDELNEMPIFQSQPPRIFLKAVRQKKECIEI